MKNKKISSSSLLLCSIVAISSISLFSKSSKESSNIKDYKIVFDIKKAILAYDCAAKKAAFNFENEEDKKNFESSAKNLNEKIYESIGIKDAMSAGYGNKSASIEIANSMENISPETKAIVMLMNARFIFNSSAKFITGILLIPPFLLTLAGALIKALSRNTKCGLNNQNVEVSTEAC
jgi:hypothetical protein